MERPRAVSRIPDLLGLLAVAGCRNSGGPGTASPSAPAGRAEMGKEWFDSHCASCRGLDARNRVPVQGPSDMTIWGRSFDARLEGGAYDKTRLSSGSIYWIVEYLRSIQVAN